jgi:hypothetical protein
MKIVLCNWTEGGTALTNFPKEQLAEYEKIVEAFGSSDFVICSKACATEWYTSAQLSIHNHSLHYIGNGHCGDFWKCAAKVSPLFV